MVATYRSHSTASTSQLTADQLTLARPAGAVQGDVLVAILSMGVGTNALEPLTAPSGWVAQPGRSVGTFSSTGVYARVYTKTVGANEPTSYTWTWDYDRDNDWLHAVVIAVSGADASNPILASAWSASSGTNAIAPSLTPSESDALLICTYMGGGRGAWGTPSGMTERAEFDKGGAFGAMTATAPAPSGGTATGNKVSVTQYDLATAQGGSYLIRAIPNVAPNAPTLTSLANGETVYVDAENIATHAFSDPDAGDSQSAFDSRIWALDGAGARTSLEVDAYVETWQERHILPPNSLTVGPKERQVRTYDALGKVGPWSTSGFFSVGTRPPGPEITSHSNGGTVAATETVVWSVPEQAAYQVQVLDGATVVSDTGRVAQVSTRSHALTFPTNNVTRTIRVRSEKGGLWSAWYEITVSVSYTRPPAPTLVVAAAPEQGAVSVSLTNPPPGTGEPSTSYNDLYVRAASGDPYRPPEGVRIATEKPLNSVHIDHLAASDVNYEYQAVAVASNGTTAASAWTPLDPTAEPTIYFGGSFD